MTSTPLMTADRAEWHERRRHCIGGSDVATLFGLNPYTTIRDLWLLKRGEIAPEELDNYHIRRGNRLEPVALAMLAEQTGGNVLRAPTLKRAEGVPAILGGNPDALLVTEEYDVLVEVKCPGLSSFRKMQREGLSEAYILQLQHYLGVYGMTDGLWVIYCAELDELATFPVKADPMMFAAIGDAAAMFWQHVIDGTEPPAPIFDEPDAKAEVVQVGEVEKRGDAEWRDAALDYRSARTLREEAELLEAAAKARVVELMGDRRGCFEGAGLRVYYTEQAGRRTFDAKALEKMPLVSIDDLIPALVAAGVATHEEAQGFASRLPRPSFDECYKTSKASSVFKPYLLGGAS